MSHVHAEVVRNIKNVVEDLYNSPFIIYHTFTLKNEETENKTICFRSLFYTKKLSERYTLP